MRSSLLKTAVIGLALLLATGTASAEIFKKSTLYVVDVSGWKHNPSPRGDFGDIFACDACDAQVQVQIDYGSPLPADSEYKTNAEFLARLDSEKDQHDFAEALLESAIPPDSGLEISIEKVGKSSVGGLKAFQYSALVSTSPEATRESAFVAIHKNRIVKITVNYFDSAMNDKAGAAIAAFIKSLKFS